MGIHKDTVHAINDLVVLLWRLRIARPRYSSAWDVWRPERVLALLDESKREARRIRS